MELELLWIAVHFILLIIASPFSKINSPGQDGGVQCFFLARMLSSILVFGGARRWKATIWPVKSTYLTFVLYKSNPSITNSSLRVDFLTLKVH